MNLPVVQSFKNHNATSVEWKDKVFYVSFAFKPFEFLNAIVKSTQTKVDDTIAGLVENAANLMLPDSVLFDHNTEEFEDKDEKEV